MTQQQRNNRFMTIMRAIRFNHGNDFKNLDVNASNEVRRYKRNQDQNEHIDDEIIDLFQEEQTKQVNSHSEEDHVSTLPTRFKIHNKK